MDKSIQQRPAPWSRPYTFDRVVRMLITIATLFGVVWLVNVLRDVLLPFLVAWLVSYLLEPFVQYNRRLLRVRGRALPVFMTLFEMCLTLIMLGVFFVPSILTEMNQVAQLVRNYASGSSVIPFIPQEFHDFLRNSIDFESISNELTGKDVQSIIETLGGVLSSGVSFVISLFNWFIVLLYVVFIMLDYEKLLSGFKHMVPPKFRPVTFKIGNDVKNSMNHYFRGQALVAFCVGILFSIGFLIVGLPLAVVLGLFIGLLNMVPYLQLISIVPTTLLCLVYTANSDMGFWEIWWSCMLVYIVVQCIQDLFLTPRIMGRAMGLNPAIILLSLSVWGTLLGFIGLIIALPLTTLLLAYYNQYIRNREDGGSDEERRKDAGAFERMTHTTGL
ncbi:MAG: AI-2E family transporter [Bacteroidales bacterium]|nr:AI-2E family transporter [Bacteroidales bacterium]